MCLHHDCGGCPADPRTSRRAQEEAVRVGAPSQPKWQTFSTRTSGLLRTGRIVCFRWAQKALSTTGGMRFEVFPLVHVAKRAFDLGRHEGDQRRADGRGLLATVNWKRAEVWYAGDARARLVGLEDSGECLER